MPHEILFITGQKWMKWNELLLPGEQVPSLEATGANLERQGSLWMRPSGMQLQHPAPSMKSSSAVLKDAGVGEGRCQFAKEGNEPLKDAHSLGVKLIPCCIKDMPPKDRGLQSWAIQ